MTVIITKKLILRAIDLLKPTIEQMVSSDDLCLGPGHVAISVITPHLDGAVGKDFSFGNNQIDPDLIERNNLIANTLCNLSHTSGSNTGQLIYKQPWMHEDIKVLYPGGHAEIENDLAVGTHGGVVYDIADLISRSIFHHITTLSYLKLKPLIDLQKG